jgi:hypothetical protein
MKAQELRLGNLIQDTIHPERQCKVFRLTSGNDFNITYQYDKSKELSYSKENIDALQPIPLTKEWLIMAGLSKVKSFDDSWLIGNFRLEPSSLCLHGYGFRIRISLTESVWLNDVDYVHQFQNLYFALTGTELTFKNKQP